MIAPILQNALDNAVTYVPPEDRPVELEDTHPATIAEAFEAYSPVIHRYNEIDGWSIYHNDQYQSTTENAIEVYLRRFLKRAYVDDKRVQTTPTMIRNVTAELASLPQVYIKPSQKAPCSLNGRLDPARTLALRNGLLDIRNPSKPVLCPHDPSFYTFNYAPFDFDPDADCPTWDKCLEQYYRTADGTPDELVPDILHSWIKKWLLRDTSHQKVFAIIGPPRSGKGTTGRIINRIIGQENVAPLSIAQLTRNFGLQPLINKQLAIMWDASINTRNTNTAAAVEILKNISGEDRFTIDRKNREQLSNIKLDLSILMIANKLVDLRDSTGALASRFTYLQTTGSFYGHEDPTIESKLEAELPGILNRVIAAPEGQLMEHPKSLEMQQDFEHMSNPYMAFVHDVCTLDPDSFIPAEMLWHYYKAWATENNHGVPSQQKFKAEFGSGVRGVEKYRPRVTEHDKMVLREEFWSNLKGGPELKIQDRPRCFKGITVKPHTFSDV